ncbi:unnamed protein product [marine sediment metagenome]|uniref:Uncharacterized protein n=1 Tax=marine sediment metagenome TaxID=412755 RepID=X1G645_9ZZZZ
MSEPEEVLFEIDGDKEMVKAVGVLLDAPVEKLKIYVNGVDVNRTMKITSLKIVKVL